MFRTDSACRFRQDLKISNHRVLHQQASPEGFARRRVLLSASVLFDPPDTFENVLDVSRSDFTVARAPARRTTASKTDSLAQDFLPQARMKRGRRGDFNLAAEFRFEIRNQAAGEERSARGSGFDEQIEVAVQPFFAAGERSENTNPRDSMPLGYGHDDGALPFADVVQGHRKLHSHHGFVRGYFAGGFQLCRAVILT